MGKGLTKVICGLGYSSLQRYTGFYRISLFFPIFSFLIYIFFLSRSFIILNVSIFHFFQTRLDFWESRNDYPVFEFISGGEHYA